MAKAWGVFREKRVPGPLFPSHALISDFVVNPYGGWPPNEIGTNALLASSTSVWF